MQIFGNQKHYNFGFLYIFKIKKTSKMVNLPPKVEKYNATIVFSNYHIFLSFQKYNSQIFKKRGIY